MLDKVLPGWRRGEGVQHASDGGPAGGWANARIGRSGSLAQTHAPVERQETGVETTKLSNIALKTPPTT